MTRYYTGVGSRTTPPEILATMSLLGEKLAEQGWILRSGGAKGADTAFALRVRNQMKDIYLPQPLLYPPEQWSKARAIAEQVHPAWHRLKTFVQDLHTRNVFQVLGLDLETPSKFLVCYTHDGAEFYDDCSITTGGTGTAIKVATLNYVPVFNLQRPKQLLRIIEWVEGESS